MTQHVRLGSIRNYLNNFKENKLIAQNQSSPFKLAIKRLPFKPINGEYPASATQTSAVLKDPLKIIDLNYDCLERIFNGFDLGDLVTIGSTCTYLQSAAQRYFQSKYRKHNLFIDCNQYPNYNISSRAAYQRSDNGNNIEEFLFVFGEVISKLTLHHMSPILKVDPERLESDTKIQHLIEKYCRKHLHEIRFRNCGKLTMNGAQPFEEVTKVSFDRCVLGEKVANFEYLFPKMRKLDMIDCDVWSVRGSIEKEFPKLEHFHLSVPYDVNSVANLTFTVANVQAAIQQNPSIKSLSLCYWNATAYDAKLLKYAADNLHQLKSLQLYHLRYTDFHSHGDIHFPSVQKLTLANHLGYKLGDLEKNLAALTFENLRKFSIVGEFDSECTAFMARHKTIKELSIIPNGEHRWYPSDEDVIRSVAILPNLEKLMTDGSRLTANGLIRLVSKRSKLSLIKVHRYTISAAIRKLLRWKCTQLEWNAAFGAGHDSEMIIKRQKINFS